ncbi:MAG: hypothetical protein M3N17_01395 [Actinomycetota bacterium]|nr:hypothetical protein [Actinomycetota bacterium]
MTVLAHGLGGRSDLPVPLWMALYGGGAAVVVSFVALGALWVTPRLSGATAGRPLPARLQFIVQARRTRVALRTLSLAGLVATVTVGVLGTPSSATNPAPTWLYVWFWVGLVPASLLFGPVWRALNPLRGISALLDRVIQDPSETAVRALPERLGHWPAVASLAVFLWIELVSTRPDSPAVVVVFCVGYTLVHVGAGLVYGRRWFAHGDGFEVYSTLLGHLAPVGRRADGRIVLRNPLDGLAALRVDASRMAVVCLLLGSTAFDGLSRTSWWEEVSARFIQSPPLYILLGTAGLAGAVGLVVLTFVLGARLAATLGAGTRLGDDGRSLPCRFAHSLVPIATGYTVAHYFSLLVFEGQKGYILASDPLGTGANLFGTANWAIDYQAVSLSTIAWVQVLAIVVGHVVGVVVTHDRAVGLFAPGDRTRAQYPLLAVMVFYTCAGIGLLLGA